MDTPDDAPLLDNAAVPTLLPEASFNSTVVLAVAANDREANKQNATVRDNVLAVFMAGQL